MPSSPAAAAGLDRAVKASHRSGLDASSRAVRLRAAPAALIVQRRGPGRLRCFCAVPALPVGMVGLVP